MVHPPIPGAPGGPVDFVIIDAMNVARRMYHNRDTKWMSSPPIMVDGEMKPHPTNMIFGFHRMVSRLERDFQPQRVFIAMEGGNDARKGIYSLYKAGRATPPKDFLEQARWLPKFCRTMGWTVIKEPNAEADDVIAAFCSKASEKGKKTIVASTDKDLFRLQSDFVFVSGTRQSWSCVETVTERFGVTPDKIADFLSIAGDSADGIPGIPGIGDTGAAKLINRFGSADGIFANIGQLSPTMARKINEGRESFEMSRKLVDFLPVNLTDDLFYGKTPPDYTKACQIFSILGMNSTLKSYREYHNLDSSPQPNRSSRTSPDACKGSQSEPEGDGISAQTSPYAVSPDKKNQLTIR